MSRSLKAHLLLVFVTFVWGATFVSIKEALAQSTPLTFNAVRMTLAALILIAVFRKDLRNLSREVVLGGMLVGVFLWLGYEFQTPGLQYTTASKSAFLTGMSVVLVPLFLMLFWRRHVNRWSLIGVGVAFVGLYLMTIPSGDSGLTSVNRGDILTMLCAVAFAFQIIFVGRVTHKHPFAPVVTIEAATCAVLMIISAPILERPHIIFTGQVIWAILITGVLGTALGFGAQGWAQQFTPPTHTALIFSLEPVFALGTSYLVIGERLGWRAGIGAALILGGVILSEVLGAVQQPAAELSEETGD
ncbi:MAG TPA: DMT family transporter [Terriglobales bacterium]